VYSHAGDDPITCKDYVRQKAGLPAFQPRKHNGISPADIRRSLMAAIAAQKQEARTPPKGSQIVATYDYTDANGALLYQICRLEPKSFRQRRPDGNGGWKWDAGERRVPYRLSDLLRFPDATVFVTEGEKDADRIASLRQCATTVACGKWTENCVKALAGRDCLILEDNDDAGRKRAREAAEALHRTAKTIRIVRLPDLPDKGDVSDWLEADPRNANRLVEICFNAPLWTPDTATAEKPNGTALQVIRADAVPQKPVDWLWQNRIARGKLTLIAGDPGIGKSQIATDVIARTTTGAPWPDGGTAPRGSCIILSSEDAANDTICPRLELAGADLGRVSIVQSITEKGQQRGFSLQRDLEALAAAARWISDVILVSIDPITAYLGDNVDSHRTADVRSVLSRVEHFADEHSIAIWAITHPPKAVQSKALNSFTGSLAFVASARLAFVAIEEAETDRSLLLAVKNNLGPKAEGLGYRLVQGWTSRGILTSQVAWDAMPVTVTANEALAAAADEAKRGGQRREAKAFLNAYLEAGPMPAESVKQAAEDNGISERTLARAKKDLGVIVKKDGFAGGWTWALPA
jgi:hypothetical protein